jgi:hypothetical protein
LGGTLSSLSFGGAKQQNNPVPPTHEIASSLRSSQ